MASFGQLERKRIGQRTKAVLDQKKREGVRLGRPRSLSAKTVTQIRNLARNGHSAMPSSSDWTRRASPPPRAAAGRRPPSSASSTGRLGESLSSRSAEAPTERAVGVVDRAGVAVAFFHSAAFAGYREAMEVLGREARIYAAAFGFA